MQKILADEAYEKVFREWITNNLLGMELEITAPPPHTEDLLPSNGGGSRSAGLPNLTSFEGWTKTTKKLLPAPKLGFCGIIAK